MNENNDQVKTETPENPSVKKGNPMIFVGAGLLVLLVIGGYLLSQKKEVASEKTGTNQITQGFANEESTESISEAVSESSNTNATSTSGTTTPSITADSQNIKVEGGTYYFKPNKITVKNGVPVKLTFTNIDGMHDFVIDELKVKTNVIQTGKSETVEFTPTKAGTYQFYCSVGNHQAMGMQGTLVVE